MLLTDCVALVTGGASGLGLATAKRLGRLGAQGRDRRPARANGQAEAAALGENARFSPTDVTSESDVQAAVEHRLPDLWRLNLVVNCAGIAIALRTLTRRAPTRSTLFQKVISVNIAGTFNVIRLAALRMQNNEPNAGGERGVIVNTASVAAYDGQIGQAAYSASKGGVVGMTLPIARDLARTGIRVCTIAPGLFKTPMLAGCPRSGRRTSSPQQVPFPNRLGDPDEYGQLVVSILENAMLNGESSASTAPCVCRRGEAAVTPPRRGLAHVTLP
jgi:3-hydroxyacyl-CoA dehydrogenase/3-hydroxy-2-methylbutyryl-CoA dehydrogenase